MKQAIFSKEQISISVCLLMNFLYVILAFENALFLHIIYVWKFNYMQRHLVDFFLKNFFLFLIYWPWTSPSPTPNLPQPTTPPPSPAGPGFELTTLSSELVWCLRPLGHLDSYKNSRYLSNISFNFYNFNYT